MSRDRKTGRAGSVEKEDRRGAEVPAHVSHARHLARVLQTLERFGPDTARLGAAATDAPAPPPREMPPQKAHPSDSDDAPPLPAREREDRAPGS